MIGAICGVLNYGNILLMSQGLFGLGVFLQENLELLICIIMAIFFSVWRCCSNTGKSCMNYYEAFKWTNILYAVGSIVCLIIGIVHQTTMLDYYEICPYVYEQLREGMAESSEAEIAEVEQNFIDPWCGSEDNFYAAWGGLLMGYIFLFLFGYIFELALKCYWMGAVRQAANWLTREENIKMAKTKEQNAHQQQQQQMGGMPYPNNGQQQMTQQQQMQGYQQPMQGQPV